MLNFLEDATVICWLQVYCYQIGCLSFNLLYIKVFPTILPAILLVIFQSVVPGILAGIIIECLSEAPLGNVPRCSRSFSRMSSRKLSQKFTKILPWILWILLELLLQYSQKFLELFFWEFFQKTLDRRKWILILSTLEGIVVEFLLIDPLPRNFSKSSSSSFSWTFSGCSSGNLYSNSFGIPWNFLRCSSKFF